MKTSVQLRAKIHNIAQAKGVESEVILRKRLQ